MQQQQLFIQPKIKIVDFRDEKMIPAEVSRFLNISSATVLNLKLNRIELSERKHFFMERDVLGFVNQNYFPSLIVGSTSDKEITWKDRLLSTMDIVKIFKNISYPTIVKYRNDRKLGYVKITNFLYRFLESDVSDFINNSYKDLYSYED